jgi:pimeloyl-ACP methyl ester carboxylesterase
VRDEARRAQILDWICRTDRAIYAHGLAAQLGSDLREVLPQITSPVLVLGTWPSGQSLGWNRENTEQRLADQYKGLARLQVRVHESAGHFIMFDDPAGLIQTIQEFAAGHE